MGSEIRIMSISYSVAIRSVRANEFLNKTLESLQNQTVLPNEIVIVIPDDVRPWDIAVPNVRFVNSVRGMVTQRSAGILAAKNNCLLLLDDDVVLSSNMAEVLISNIKDRKAACVLPYWAEGWPRKQFIKAYMAFWRMAIPQRKGGIRYSAGGGYFYPTQEPNESLETEGGSGAVIMIDRDFCVQHGCLGDMDLQAVSVYALREDGAFILDISRKGGLCLMVGGVNFEHLGGTTRLDPSRLEITYKAQVVNHYLFWKKYIYPQNSYRFVSKMNAKMLITRYMLGIILLACVVTVRSMSFQPVIGICSGFKYLLNFKNKI